MPACQDSVRALHVGLGMDGAMAGRPVAGRPLRQMQPGPDWAWWEGLCCVHVCAGDIFAGCALHARLRFAVGWLPGICAGSGWGRSSLLAVWRLWWGPAASCGSWPARVLEACSMTGRLACSMRACAQGSFLRLCGSTVCCVLCAQPKRLEVLESHALADCAGR